MKRQNNYKAIFNTDHQNISLLLKSLLVGLLSGLVVVAYRFVLAEGEAISQSMYAAVRAHPAVCLALFPSLVLSGLGVGFLCRKFPLIGGSGIPQVKGILLGYFQNRWLSTLLAKFLGGAVSVLAGLSLGREGPSIQLGACVADGLSDKLANTRMQRKLLMASGASAGLAAAFNAPLAGVIFTLEEVFKYFSPAILMSAMTSAVTADFVAKQAFGMGPIFQFNATQSLPLYHYWLLLPFGVIIGLGGAFYNYTLLATQRAYKKASRLPDFVRPVIPFLLAGVLGLCFPYVLGGGHYMVEQLTMSTAIRTLVLLLAVKFIFSMISFGSGAPGGIFFPLLVLGASIGAIFGKAAVLGLHLDEALFFNFVILAMAGFFAAIVRAPITGIVLITEMTGTFSHLLSLTVVAIVAYVTADLAGGSPIYDSLLAGQVKALGTEKVKARFARIDSDKKITMEEIVHHHSLAAGSLVKDIPWPDKCLLVSIRREGAELIPKGDMEILPGDYLICLTNLKLEVPVRRTIQKLTKSQPL